MKRAWDILCAYRVWTLFLLAVMALNLIANHWLDVMGWHLMALDIDWMRAVSAIVIGIVATIVQMKATSRIATYPAKSSSRKLWPRHWHRVTRKDKIEQLLNLDDWALKHNLHWVLYTDKDPDGDLWIGFIHEEDLASCVLST